MPTVQNILSAPTNDANQDTPSMSRREALKTITGIAAITSPASTQAGLFDAVNGFADAIRRDSAAKATELNRDKLITMLAELSESGKGTGKPVQTPVDKPKLHAQLRGGYTVLSFQFAACADACPPMQIALHTLEEKLAQTPQLKNKATYVTIDASAQAPDLLQQKLQRNITNDAKRVLVFAPPFNHEKPAKDMQEAVGFVTSSITKRDGETIKVLGHSPRIHIFAPDGTLLTKDNPINGVDPKAADAMLAVIQTHAKKQSPSR
jgi:cytochrome oxidase Cu insertion factor (SCO1/SenC/PrrC family)